jgi:hypothetical protein
VWRDRNGSLWFAIWLQLPSGHIEMHPGDPTGHLVGYKPEKVLADVGPLTLVHREPGEVSDVD